MLWQLQILGELAAAILLGGLIGLEREVAGKAAGLRTHMMVCGSAALVVALGEVTMTRFTAGPLRDIVESDPLRIMGAVITGISFLGAGTIIRRPDTERVEGLTTSASILMTAGIGMCVALAQWLLAVGAVVLVVGILRCVGWVEHRIAARSAGQDHTQES